MKEENRLGQNIKLLRKTRGITKTELSKQIGYSLPYISKLENNKVKIPSFEFVYALSKIFNFKPEILYYSKIEINITK